MKFQEISKITTYVGFAIKANKVIWGADNIIEYLKKIHLVIVSEDINKTSMSKLISYCKTREIYIVTVDLETLYKITNKENCKAIAIRDYNLANAIKDKIGVL